MLKENPFPTSLKLSKIYLSIYNSARKLWQSGGNIQCIGSSSEWVWNLMIGEKCTFLLMRSFLSFKFLRWNRYGNKFVKCICMVSADYTVCSCGAFCNYKEFTFFDPKKLLELYPTNLIFFEFSLNYPKVDTNSYWKHHTLGSFIYYVQVANHYRRSVV